MTEKLNHFVCPNCGHDFYAGAAYAQCDACFTVFYASQSRTCQPLWRNVNQTTVVRQFVTYSAYEDPI